ncbi:MAG: alanine dehydrogenase [Acidobacteria bacterium]|nr:alanine dehydrogenase [Acidobacteriota bacterium]MCB9397849.1 alanine dehydrogenase [Acidobacteriota bacterium]
MLKVCVRRETKNQWERRTPLNTDALAELLAKDVPVSVESSPIRIYTDQQYADKGASVVASTKDFHVVIGIKEPKISEIQPGQVHLAFSHTIKGQPYNMPLLRHFIETGSTLIDYETMCDPKGKRVIAFGRFAGLAGAIDTLWLAGKKWALKHGTTALSKIKQTSQYESLFDIRAQFKKLAPILDPPIRVALVGTGNVGHGAEEILTWLGLPKVEPEIALQKRKGPFYFVLNTKDIHEHKEGKPFDRNEFRSFGAARYRSVFDRYLGHFDILLQTPFWDEKFPRHLSHERMLANKAQLPWMIGDISCDINGSLACTHKASTIDNPVFTYDVDSNSIQDELSWQGPSVMSIDNLPCELSKDASDHFSGILKAYIPEIARMDLDQPLETNGLSNLMQQAVIVYRGKLTPRYEYLKSFLG